MGDLSLMIFTLLWALFVLYVLLWLYILLPAEMARNRGRSQAVWVLFSILVTPFLAILLLWALGEAET